MRPIYLHGGYEDKKVNLLLIPLDRILIHPMWVSCVSGVEPRFTFNWLSPLEYFQVVLVIYCCNNYYKLTGLKQQKFIILQFWGQKSEIHCTGLKSRRQQGKIPSRSPRGEAFCSPFPASRGHLHFLTHDHFLYLQSLQHSLFKSLSLAIFHLLRTLVIILHPPYNPG